MSAKATRASFGEAIQALGAENDKIVVFDADLSCSTKSEKFAKAHSERFFQMGIAESNMVGTAAGISFMGYVPFICSFGAFVATRYETIRVSVGYSNANVKIIGTHAGLGIGEDGYSQMGLEDMAVLRSLKNMIILNPCDDLSTKAAIKYAADHLGPAYIRLTRQNLPAYYQSESEFSFGKGTVLKEGKDIALIGTGASVAEAMKASEVLADMNPWVVDIHTIKPIDKDLIQSLAKSCKAIVTMEDHHVVGGLGSAVSEVLAEMPSHAPLHRIGVEDYGESGDARELYKKYGIDGEVAAQKLRETIKL